MTPEHLGDDALSALLDGEATLEEAAHAEDCAVCSVRAGELRRAANLIGGPVVPVDEEQRNAAIAAALDAQVTSLDAVRRRRRPPAWIAGAAALVLLGLGLVPLLTRDSDREQQSTASDAAREAPTQESAGTGAGESDAMMSAPAASGPVDAGDLGALDADDLPDRVRAALLDGGTGRDGDDGHVGPACEEELRTTDPSLGLLRLFGRATVEGRAGHLTVFEVPGSDSPSLRAYVVADGDCGDILRTATFPAP